MHQSNWRPLLPFPSLVRPLDLLQLNSRGGWESGGPGRVANGGGVDSMLRFWLEGRGNGMKHCIKMKRRQ
jgi:hypothetical protein